MKKVLVGLAIFVSLSDIALSKEVGSAQFRLDRVNMPGAIKADNAKVNGEYKLEGNTISGKFVVKLEEFSLGMPLLKTHTCEKLECVKYPEAVFDLDTFEMKDGEVKGSLTLRGITKRVSGWKAEVDGKDITVKGIVKLSDFNIEAPSYAGVGVSNEAELTIEVTI